MFKPNREFQAGLNPEDSRRRRQNASLSLRRKDRESKLQKKRQRILQRNQESPTQNDDDTSPAHDTRRGNSKASVQDLTKLVNGVYSEHPAAQYECTKQFRMLLSQAQNPPIKAVIDSGVVPRFIQLARMSNYPELQYESLWALLNIASGPAECTAHIIRNGSHNVFIDLLHSPLYEIREQALWALGNIAGDGAELKDLLLKNNILPNILAICRSTFDAKFVTNFNKNQAVTANPKCQFHNLFNTASWTLSNLCRGSPPPNEEYLEVLIQCLQYLLKQALHIQNDRSNKDDIVMNIGWAFSYLTQYDQYHKAMVNKLGNDGTIQQFVNLMDHDATQIRHPINRLIGNILTGSDDNTKQCLNLGILNKYHKILTQLATQKEKKEICWSLSNITAGPLEDKLLVLEAKLYPILIDLLNTMPYDTGKEGLWALSNATTDHDKRIINALVEFGIVPALCNFLRGLAQSKKKDKILMVALECMENILIVGHQHLCQGEPNKFAKLFEEDGACQSLEDLQADDNMAEPVYDKCVEIITKYFDGFEETTDNALDYGNNNNNNNANNGQFAFGTSGNDATPFGF
eukprot:81328_1